MSEHTRTSESTQRCLRHACMLILLMLSLMVVSTTALANALKNAKNAFAQGDLPTAVSLLEPQLFPKAKISGKELEETRGLYGIAQFMLGNQSKSEQVFKQMIATNPKARLDKKFILDPATNDFFEKLKQGSGSAGRSSRRDAQKGRPNAANVRVTPPPEVKRNKPEISAPASAQIFTGLQISVNAPRATLFADGIFIGSADQKISMEPGKHTITISAEGYVTTEQTIKIDRGKTLQLKVNLKKIQPQTNNSGQPRSAQVNNQNNGVQQRNSGKEGGLNSRAPKRSMNFNSDLPADKSSNRSRSSQADQYFQEPQQQQPQYAQPPQQQYAPPPAQYPPPQQYAPAQPQYVQPPQYAPPQQYPPAYQQPQYAYPPPVYVAPPAYGYPDPYAQPPGYSAPPPPGYGAPDPYEEEYEAADQYESSPRSSARPRKKGKRKASALLAALPFGVGQFQNSENGKGAIFLVAEAGALGYGLYVKFKVIPDATKKFEEYRAGEQELPIEERDVLEAEREQFLKKMDSYYLYSMLGAGAFYLIGVVDAFSNMDSGSTRRRATEYTPSPVDTDKKFGLALAPTLEGGLKVRVSFNLD